MTLSRAARAAAAWLAAAAASCAAAAATTEVEPGGARLAVALAAAAPGDLLILKPGVHAGPAIVERAGLALHGEPGAAIDGGGRGQVVRIAAPDVSVRGLAIRGSGADFAGVDAGVFIDKTGDGAVVEGNDLAGNLFGVYLHGPERAVVRGNRISGSRNPRIADRGNGVHLWNSPGSIVEDNDIRFGRDGVFVTTSADNIFRGNRFRDLRFAVHYMYAHRGEISGNDSAGNHVGYALMYSRALAVVGNVSDGDRDHGLLFNYANRSRIENNTVRRGAGKCVFLYNSHGNALTGNLFERCGTGIHFTAGSEDNAIGGNAFVANRTQVKYVGTRWLEWSRDGRGNYWSDNPAFDLNGDGIADLPYRPNGVVDRMLWRHPLAKLLVASPAAQVLRHAQDAFPGLFPGGVIDSAPLMRPPPRRGGPR